MTNINGEIGFEYINSTHIEIRKKFIMAVIEDTRNGSKWYNTHYFS